MVAERLEDGFAVAAATAAMVMEGEEKIRVRVSFWKMVTWQALIGQFGELRIMTRVIMWLE